MIYKLNGVVFDINKQQTIGNVQWAAGDLLKNKDKWPSLGITTMADPIYPDPLLFTWTMNSDGTLNITPRTAEAIALDNAIAQENIDLMDIKAQTVVQNFLSKTPAQIDTYFNNVTTVAGCVLALRILTKAVLILARRSFR